MRSNHTAYRGPGQGSAGAPPHTPEYAARMRTLLAAIQLAAGLALGLTENHPDGAVTAAFAVLIFSALLTATTARRGCQAQISPEPPQRVRLIMNDNGEEVPCGVLREPALDEPGHPGWLLVPERDVGPRLDRGFQITGHVPSCAVLGVARDVRPER